MYKIREYGNNYVIDERYRDGWMISYSKKAFGDKLARKMAKETSKTGKRINNLIKIKDDLAIMYLYDKENDKIEKCYFDKEFVEKVSEKRWFIKKSGKAKYVRSSDKIYLHRFILGLTKDNKVTCDHIDCNPLNNIKENLRICSMHTNSKNRKNVINKTTGIVGVHCDGKYYIASINYDKYKNIRKHFSIKKYGKSNAFNMAIKCRQEMEKEFGYFDAKIRKLFK